MFSRTTVTQGRLALNSVSRRGSEPHGVLVLARCDLPLGGRRAPGELSWGLDVGCLVTPRGSPVPGLGAVIPASLAAVTLSSLR